MWILFTQTVIIAVLAFVAGMFFGIALLLRYIRKVVHERTYELIKQMENPANDFRDDKFTTIRGRFEVMNEIMDFFRFKK